MPSYFGRLRQGNNDPSIFDILHESSGEDEAVVLEGEPGDMSAHDSFGSFLEFRARTNELTISHLLELRAGRTE